MVQTCHCCCRQYIVLVTLDGVVTCVVTELDWADVSCHDVS